MPLQANIGPVGEVTPTKLAAGVNVLRDVATDKRDRGVFVHQIRVVNTDSAARTITIDKYDGTNAFPLVSAKSVAAHDVYTDEFEFSLGAGWSLRATPETANVLYVHVTLSSRP